MADSRYETIDSNGEKTSSHSGSTPARLTPDSGIDDEDYDLNEYNAQDGYELKELGKNEPSGSGRRGAYRESESSGHRNDEDADDDIDGDDDDDDVPLTTSRPRGVRTESAQSFELYTPDEERRVRRKLDTHLVLFVALLYMMSFLDRSNIGNAKIAGLTTDLRLSPSQYEWLLTAFYISYVLFEWMTLCYKIFPPHIYISSCVAAWGVLASLQSLAQNFPSMLVLRTLLGIGEAAFVGIPLYLSFFFRRDELAFRTGLFISAAPLATCFASTLAYGIVKFGGKLGIASWRLLFLLEGFPACVVAVWAWVWLPDGPETARWLSKRERKIAELRMRKEAGEGIRGMGRPNALRSDVPRHKRRFRWGEVWSTLRDPKSYLTAAMLFCCNVAFSSMPVFLPTIVNQMGYSTLASQGLSAPPFLFAFFVVLLTAFLSDYFRSRSIPMVFHALMAMSGYIFLALAGTFQFGHIVRYLAVFPICAGFFSAVTIVITWTVNNQATDEGKGTGVAVLNVIGQMGPLLGTRLYPDTDKPYYVKGMSVCAGAMAIVAVLAYALHRVLAKENNRRKARWQESEGLVGGTLEKDFMFIT